MSLLSKGLKKLGGNIRTISKVPVLGSLIKSIPGVGTAIAIGTAVSEGAGLIKRARAGIAPPPTYIEEQQAGVGSLIKTLPAGTIARTAGKIAAGGAAAYGISKLFNGDGPKRRRSMNAFNPKALSRAHRRIEGFSNQSRKVLREIGISVSATRRPTLKRG